jgi:hypothetical protein
MKKERRWLKSAIAASAAPLPALPWARASRPKRAISKQRQTLAMAAR